MRLIAAGSFYYRGLTLDSLWGTDPTFLPVAGAGRIARYRWRPSAPEAMADSPAGRIAASFTLGGDLKPRQPGLEPGTAGLETRCSVRLSYWRNRRRGCLAGQHCHLLRARNQLYAPVRLCVAAGRSPPASAPPLTREIQLRAQDCFPAVGGSFSHRRE